MNKIGDSKYSSSYAFTMRDAHRKPAQPICGPALSCHLGFKKDQKYSNEFEWLERIDLLIIEIAAQLIAHDGDKKIPVSISNLSDVIQTVKYDENNNFSMPPVQLMRGKYTFGKSTIKKLDELVLDGSRYETVVIEGGWHHLPVWIRFEAFEEFFTITSTISLRSNSATGDYSKAYDKIVNTISKTHNKKYQRRDPISKDVQVDALSSPPDTTSSHKDLSIKEAVKMQISDDVSKLYTEIWDLFQSQIFGPALSNPVAAKSDESLTPIFNGSVLAENNRLTRLRQKKIGSERFADFRGIIFCLDGQSNWNRFRKTGEQTIDETKMTHLERVNAITTESTALAGATGIEFTEKLFPVLYAIDRNPVGPPFEAAEYTFSTFDNNRCLYGSSFGPQLQQEPSPLHYVLLAAHDEHRQLGRVVNRLHLMGTLRLAALFDFDKVITRQNILLRLDNELHSINFVESEFELIKQKRKVAERLKEVRFDLDSKLSALVQTQGFLKDNIHGYDRYHKRYESDIEILSKITSELSIVTNDSKIIFNCTRSIETRIEVLREIFLSASEFKQVLRKILNDDSRDNGLNPTIIEKIRDVIRELSHLMRLVDSLIDTSTSDLYRRKVISHVKKALTSMDDRVRFGIPYRADRSKYNQEQFFSLVAAMRIDKIEGYQPYNVFVQQRLERSFSLISQIGAMHKRLSDKIADIEKALDAKKTEEHSEQTNRQLEAAEIITALILVPHYSGELAYNIKESIVTIFGKSYSWIQYLNPLNKDELASLMFLLCLFVYWRIKTFAPLVRIAKMILPKTFK